MTRIGHNSGFDPNGYTGRLHQWRRARSALVSNRLPIEVIRSRVKRAAALGLDFKTYASIRAASGRDVLALLFSSNALGMLRQAELDARAAAKLPGIEAQRAALIHAPLSVVATAPIDWAARAPAFTDSPAATRDTLIAALREHKLPGDAVLMIGATAVEREWCASARAAGWLSADRYFAA